MAEALSAEERERFAEFCLSESALCARAGDERDHGDWRAERYLKQADAYRIVAQCLKQGNG